MPSPVVEFSPDSGASTPMVRVVELSLLALLPPASLDPQAVRVSDPAACAAAMETSEF